MAIAQFVNGLITKLKLNELVDGINGNTDNLATLGSTISNMAHVLLANESKTIGVGGDFLKLSDALNFYKKFIPNGYRVTFTIKTGTILGEQIYIENQDLSFIEIKSENNSIITISRSALITEHVAYAYAFMYGIKSKLPKISLNLTMDNTGDSANRCFFYLQGGGSFLNIKEGVSITSVSGVTIVNQGPMSTVIMDKIITTGVNVLSQDGICYCSAVGIKSTTDSFIHITGEANFSLSEITKSAGGYSFGVFIIDSGKLRCLNATIFTPDIGYSINVRNGGVAIATNSTGTLSQTANTLTSNGIIFQ